MIKTLQFLVTIIIPEQESTAVSDNMRFCLAGVEAFLKCIDAPKILYYNNILLNGCPDYGVYLGKEDRPIPVEIALASYDVSEITVLGDVGEDVYRIIGDKADFEIMHSRFCTGANEHGAVAISLLLNPKNSRLNSENSIWSLVFNSVVAKLVMSEDVDISGPVRGNSFIIGALHSKQSAPYELS